MQSELRGSVSKLPISYTRTLINRAWREVRDANLWSFQLFESSWITPPLINTGTVAVVQGVNTVTFDAAAIVALVSNIYSFLTQRQFRTGVGGIYNIIAYDSTTGIATLDRPFADASNSAAAYQVYQVYYVAPYKDFRTWLSVRNPQQFIDLDLDTTRSQIDAMDPQRSWYQFPTRVVPWGIDLRGQGQTDSSGNPLDSATLGFPVFELWGQPVQPFVYQCYGIRRGTELTAPTDTLPLQVGEDLVLMKAREMAYEWAEANKGMQPRLIGPDWRFLLGTVQAAYKKLLVKYRMVDKDFIDNWYTSHKLNPAAVGRGYYNTMSGYAGVGVQQ
jgi:hypothetical protein